MRLDVLEVVVREVAMVVIAAAADAVADACADIALLTLAIADLRLEAVEFNIAFCAMSSSIDLSKSSINIAL